MKRKKILYIVPHRYDRSPGQRFRCEQYIPYLEQSGYIIKYSNLLSKRDDFAFYAKGKYLAKFFILVKSIFKRIIDVFRAFHYDYIFIYRESIMIGTNIFDRLMKLAPAKIIFDFDDSIWLDDTSEGNENLRWLKKTSKTNTSIKLADMVFAGNSYLANHALQFNENVKIVPTTIDLKYHKTQNIEKRSEVVTIGWTGTSTTIKHFESIVPVLIKLKAKYGKILEFKLISDKDYSNSALGLSNTFWSRETEIQELETIDIGIMPLPDNKWTRGKCGFKGLQYMALGKPTVMSGVGVNKDIIDDGINGYIANTEAEWEEKLSELVENSTLRSEIGTQGKKTIEENYSVASLRDTYVGYFDKL